MLQCDVTEETNQCTGYIQLKLSLYKLLSPGFGQFVLIDPLKHQTGWEVSVPFSPQMFYGVDESWVWLGHSRTVTQFMTNPIESPGGSRLFPFNSCRYH